MKIDGTDASSLVNVTPREVVTENRNNKIDTKDMAVAASQAIDTKNISQMNSFERRELPISDKIVIDAIEKANKAISGANRRFEFSIHEKTKEIMVKVIDSETNEVVREIPNEKILDMVARMWEMAGLIVDERR
jgi:Uncharacterized flagellar protein FlaG